MRDTSAKPNKDNSIAWSNRLGRWFRELRQRQNLDLRDLAERINLSIATISRIERGYKGITLQTLFRMCRGLHVNLDDLLLRLYGRDTAELFEKEAGGLNPSKV